MANREETSRPSASTCWRRSSGCSCCSSTARSSTIVILSFQGPDGGLTFPMNGVSPHWFANLFEQQAVGDFGGSLTRSLAARR